MMTVVLRFFRFVVTDRMAVDNNSAVRQHVRVYRVKIRRYEGGQAEDNEKRQQPEQAVI
jgi:hypothetical protein